MASLPPLTGYNLGGIDQFWFIPVDDVQSIPDEESNVIEQDIQLVGDAKFSVGYATQETLQFTENQNRDAQGNFYEQSLSGFYPKDQENVANLFEGMAAERFIVIFRDNNGYYKLLGSLANPCKFTATFESGDSANGRNGYSFEFTRTDVEKAPFYRGVIDESEKVINTDPCAGLEKPVTQTYTLTFEANSAKYNALTIEQGGTIQQIDAPSGTKIFKSISTSPFQQQVGTGDSVSEGDILQVELDSAPTERVTVEIVVSYSDVSVSKTLPKDLGGDGEYMYVVSQKDQEVYAIERSSKSVKQTISIPSGNTVKIPVYRYQDKTLRVFGGERMVVIDADPSSNDFNKVVNDVSLPNPNFGSGSITGACHDFYADEFYLGEDALKYDLNSIKKLREGTDFYGRDLSSQTGFTFIATINAVDGGRNQAFLSLDSLVCTFYDTAIRTKGDVFYSKTAGLLIAYDSGNRRVCALSVIKGYGTQLKATISTANANGPGFYVPETDKFWAFDQLSPNADIIDLKTLTVEDNGNFQSQTGFFPSAWASRIDGYIYLLDSDNGEVIVLDPTKPVSNSKVTTISLPMTSHVGGEIEWQVMAANQIRYL